MTTQSTHIDFDAALNAEQRAAACAQDGPALVLAAAGTGKTRTLVYRVAYLVERGIDPARILLLTFTNRAAREMLERATELVGNVGGIWGGTFHHMANRLLRRHADLIGFSRTYTILDRDDSLKLIRNAMQDFKLKGREFPRPAVLMSILGSAVNSETPLQELVDDWFADLDGQRPFGPEDLMRVLNAYIERKRELDAMDFDDLLVNGLRLFREHEGITRKYSEQFLYVLVDEYQDTNLIQAEWIDRVAGEHRNLLVVGDDFQSIYSWRGADYRNIMSFQERYPDAGVYMLETNYRSVPEVLEIANACIEKSRNQFPKTLRSTREPYHPPAIMRPKDGAEQAWSVLNQVAQFRRDGYRLSEIAVLYRAHYHALDLEMQLMRDQLPYSITSGVRFFEKAHVKDACSVLRLVNSDSDELAFSRVLELLPGVGRRTSERIWRKLGGRLDIYDHAACRAVEESLRAGARPGWKDIESGIPPRKDIDSVHGMGEIVVGFVNAFYHDYAVENFENFQTRLDELQALADYMERYETLEDFLSDVALLTNLDGEVADLEEEKETLRLSTVHQAKGLEWSAVIVLWLADGMFPSSRALGESDEGEAEERRLFYVAVTRAKDELVLCVPQSRRMPDGGVMYCEPSRFVAEIPPGMVRDIAP